MTKLTTEMRDQEAAAIRDMATGMSLMSEIVENLEKRPKATLQNIDTPEYQAAYEAWEAERDKLMNRVQAAVAERKAKTS